MLGRWKQGRAPIAFEVLPNVLTEHRVTLYGCELLGDIRVGYRSYANNSLLRNATVGRFCSIGRRCSIGAALHTTDTFSSHPKLARADERTTPPVTIGHDVWIGDNAVILSGVTLGTGSVVGAGAIVTRDVQPYEIVEGGPARQIRWRFGEELRAALLASEWWRFGDEVLERGGPDRDPAALVRALAEDPPEALPDHYQPYRRK